MPHEGLVRTVQLVGTALDNMQYQGCQMCFTEAHPVVPSSASASSLK